MSEQPGSLPRPPATTHQRTTVQKNGHDMSLHSSEHRAFPALRRRVLAPVFCALAVGVVAGCSTPAASGNTASGNSASDNTASSASSPAATSSSSSAATSSSSAPGTSGSSAPSAAEQVIMIKDFDYQVPASVSPGAEVGVMNMDSVNHTVTADEGGAFDVQTPAGKTVTFTAPSTPGTYAFHCTYHSNMHGVLVVK